MKIFFDVDFTLVGIDGRLRPGVRDVFQKLKDDDHEIYLWSGMRNPWDAVNFYQLGAFVSGCFLKPLVDHQNHLLDLNIPTPDFCVDDNKEIIDVFGGYCVPPYIYVEYPDYHMWRVYDAVANLNHNHQNGQSI